MHQAIGSAYLAQNNELLNVVRSKLLNDKTLIAMFQEVMNFGEKMLAVQIQKLKERRLASPSHLESLKLMYSQTALETERTRNENNARGAGSVLRLGEESLRDGCGKFEIVATSRKDVNEIDWSFPMHQLDMANIAKMLDRNKQEFEDYQDKMNLPVSDAAKKRQGEEDSDSSIRNQARFAFDSHSTLMFITVTNGRLLS
ncbi:hypothetical protein QFC21_006340 [Naganishia friedmannii]|uniref:Uncharacterized protein n=1 Tax=Naganishia friedmannii TaxID=89922 RepID=A0ACC2V317_9TREE|nr:hypothetical protein QFC21_006340 [Naganishia friedmannii]